MNTRMLKRISCWVISSLLCLAFMGQTTLGEEKPDTSPTILKLCSLPFLSFAPIFIAIEEGYFAEQGLKIELVKFKHGSEAVPALSQGQIDVVAGAISASFFNAVTRGVFMRAVADKGHLDKHDRSMALVVRKELCESGQFRSLQDLRGMKIAPGYPGNMNYFRTCLILRKTGVSLNDIQIVNLSQPERVLALKGGALDAALLAEPMLARIKTQVSGTIFAYAGEMYDFIYPSSQFGAIFFGPNLLEKNPKLGRRFILAYLKGIRTHNQGKTPRNIEILHKYTKIEKEILLECGWSLIYPDGHLEMDSILSYQDWLYQNGFIDRKVSPDEIVDTSFIDSANQMLSQKD